MSFLSTIKSWFGGQSDSSSQRKKFGVVNYFNRSKGYGFIDSQDMDERIFLHVSNTSVKLKIGDPVSYTLGKNQKGYVAENVEKVQ